MVEGTFSACLGPDWCPHVVQVVLAINCVGTLGKDGGAITLQKVIAPWEVVAVVMCVPFGRLADRWQRPGRHNWAVMGELHSLYI